MPKIETANASVHFLLEVRKDKQEGTIHGYIKSGGKKYKFYPGEKCPVAAWDRSKGMPKTGLNRRDFIPLANRLKEVESAMLQVWEQQQGKFTPATFRDYVNEALRHGGVKEAFGLPDFVEAYTNDPKSAIERLEELGETSRAKLFDFVRTLHEHPALTNKALGRTENVLPFIRFVPEYITMKNTAKGSNWDSVRALVKWYIHLSAFFHLQGDSDYEGIANNYQWRDDFADFLFSPQSFKFPFPQGKQFLDSMGISKGKKFDKAGVHTYSRAAMSTNTVAKGISFVVEVINEARRRGHTDAIIHKGYNLKKAKSNKVVLYANELEKIARCDLQGNERLEKVRFLLLIGCYTGLRQSDWHKINRDAIKEVEGEKLIEVITKKTKTPVHIPLFSKDFEAMLEAWDYQVPKMSGQRFNDYAKELCMLAGIDEKIDWIETTGNRHRVVKVEKWEKISSHVGRRTLATMLVENGYPASTIMLVTGHTSEKQFWEYVNLDKRRRAAAISRQMKKEKAERILKVV